MSENRVVLVAEQPILRQMLHRLLGDLVFGVATNGHEAIARVVADRPRAVLIDLDLPGLSGLETATALRRHRQDLAVVFLSCRAREDRLGAAVRLGAVGFLGRDTQPEAVRPTVRAALRSEYPIAADLLADPALTHYALAPNQPHADRRMDRSPAVLLTLREFQVLDGILLGYANRRIARALGLDEQTVKNYVTAILRKLGLHDRLDVVRHAVDAGWMNPTRRAAGAESGHRRSTREAPGWRVFLPHLTRRGARVLAAP